MTWIDGGLLLLLIGFGVLGYFTGLIQRAIGFIALYVAVFAATNMGVQTAGIIQQGWPIANVDSRVYGFFGVLFFLLIVVEGSATAVHDQLQISAVVLNHASGAAVGVITALILGVICTLMLQATAATVGGAETDPLEISVRDGVQGSHFAVPITSLLGSPVKRIFSPVLPVEPQTYFGG